MTVEKAPSTENGVQANIPVLPATGLDKTDAELLVSGIMMILTVITRRLAYRILK